ncbi:MAG: hypothetical protein HZA53_05760 [Planctomycetes bacterium]|nr:hypothetical protein [Planctomycetota bacterium]
MIAAYPWGPQLAVEVSTDEKRAFVAAGAGISVLDVTTITNGVAPTRIASFEVPECAPVAMVYNKLPNTPHRLFIAGGTMGLWRADLCPQYFDATQPACSDSFYTAPSSHAPVRMDIVESQIFERARCVDLCVVQGHGSAANETLLLVVFASRSDAPASIGPSQLRAYKLNDDVAGSWTLYGTLSLDPTTLGSTSATNVALATAIVADPADPNHVYVALNKFGLARIDITGPTFTGTPLSRPPCPFSVSPGEGVRDLAIARTATRGSFLYAAFEYTGVVEYHIDASTPPLAWPYVTLAAPLPPQPNWNEWFTERVAAVGTGSDLIYFAAARQPVPPILDETACPFRNTGHWDDHCLSWAVLDPNLPASVNQNGAGSSTVTWYARDATVVQTTIPRNVIESHSFAHYWGSLLLRQKDSTTYRLYECSGLGGTVGRELAFPTEPYAIPIHGGPPAQPTWNVSGQYKDRLFAAVDGVASVVNPGLTHFGLDGPSAPGTMEGGMLYITSGSPPDIIAVPETISMCPGGPTPGGAGCEQDPPNPFVGGLLGAVRWTDPSNPAKEWFLVGDHVLQKWDAQCGGPISGCTNPCTPMSWAQVHVQPADTSVGWRLASLTAANPTSTSIPTLSSLGIQWVYLSSPTYYTQQPGTPDLKAEDTPYVSGAPVPGPTPGSLPRLFIGVRHGTRWGLKLLRLADVMNKVNASCAGTMNGQTIILGENTAAPPLPPVLDPPFLELLTHLEFEDPSTTTQTYSPCAPWVECGGGGGHASKFQPNSRAHVARVTNTSGAARWIVLVASGFVTAHPNPAPPQPAQSTNCQWAQDYGSPETVIYDVTDVDNPPSGPSIGSAQLLRVLLGPSGVPGYAWCVRTKTYSGASPFAGRTFAFVGDMFGRLLVYDISGGTSSTTNKLYPPALTPYRDATGSGQSTVTLRPTNSYEFPKDPTDGYHGNFLDIEIDGDWAYCALGRGGVAVFNISDPTVASLHPTVILDTPGLALGLAFRVDAAGNKQLIVGDSLCGMRLYGP